MVGDTTPQALVRVYEPEKDQWLPLASMPTPRYGATSFLRGNKIYVMGGCYVPVFGDLIVSVLYNDLHHECLSRDESECSCWQIGFRKLFN